jgi:hypothetical protein
VNSTGQVYVDLETVTELLRRELAEHPPSRPLDDDAALWLESHLSAATHAEQLMLPRRSQKALEQMRSVVTGWAQQAARSGEHDAADTYRTIAALTNRAEDSFDLAAVAEAWLSYVTPVLDAARQRRPGQRLVLLQDITSELNRTPADLATLARSFSSIPRSLPLSERVTACILGVPQTGG